MSVKGVSAGNIFLNLTLNKKGFDSQLGGITKIAAKAGAAIAAAFSVKAIVDFSKECIELGSDLAEVQNVVDVTFPTMSATIDQFSKDAAEKFGLSETMAKKYAGTLGSMAEAFGFSEGQAADMAMTLAGLSGDVASFYNLSQDEAYTKLKSVFTGETESLKDLGVVMTQTALDQYALANGFGKTTTAMSEAEKVALRYAFVQDQLANATGDFSRTSDSWANQVKVLQLRIESIKASIGQGLINLFNPILVWINTIIAKLQVAADAFARFTSLFTKKDVSTSAVSSISGELTKAADSASSVGMSADNVSSGLSSAAKSAKALKRELAGFDRVTKLANEDTSSSAGGVSGTGTGSLLEGTTALAKASAKAVDNAYSPVIAKIKNGFRTAFKADVKPLKEALGSLKESSEAVWGSIEVKNAIDAFRDQSMTALGSVDGSVTSVATSMSVGVVGGVADARSEMVEFNKIKLTSIFESLTDVATTATDLSEAVADIATAFESPAFQKIVEIVSKINNAISLTVLDKIIGFSKDLLDFFIQPIIQNKEGIEEMFENVFEIISLMLSPLEKLVDFATSRSKKYEDGVVHKFMEQATSDNVQYLTTFLEWLNEQLEEFIGILSGDIKLGDVFKKYIFGDEEPNDVVVEFKAEIKQRWHELQGKWRNLTQNIKDKTVQFKAEIKQRWSDLQERWTALTQNVKDKTAQMRAEVRQKWADIQSGWTNIVNNIKDKKAQMKAEVTTKWADLKGKWNDLLSNFGNKVCSISLKFSAAASDLKEWINTNVIDRVNNKFKEVPILKKVKIPHLAQGGYVKANTPQLAVIGDNRHQGEVVAPENKLEELARKGAELASSGGRDAEIIALLRQILELLQSMNLTAYVDAEGLKRLIVKLINDHTRATGQCEIYV